MLGPAECNVFRAAGRYRYRLLVKCRNNKATRELFWRANQWYDKENMANIQIDFYYDGGVCKTRAGWLSATGPGRLKQADVSKSRGAQREEYENGDP